MYSRQISCILCAIISLGVGLANPPCEATKRRFSVADDIGVAHFGDIYTGEAEPLTFSPDGRYFVVDTERGLLDQNRPESTLRVFCTEDVHQFLLRPEITGEPSPVWIFSKSTHKDGPIITHIRWLIDSSGFAFLAKTTTGDDQLFIGDIKTKTVFALTPDDQHVTAFDIRDRNNFVYSVRSPTIREKAIREKQTSSVVGTGRFLGSLIFPTDLYPFMSRLYDLSELWAVENGKRFQVICESSGRPATLHRDGETTLALSPDAHSVVTAMAVNIVPTEWEKLYQPSLPTDTHRIRAGRQDAEALDGFGYVSEYVRIELSTGKVRPLSNAPIGNNIGWWSGRPSANWSSDGDSVVLVNTFLPPKAHDPEGQLNRPCVAVVHLAKGDVTCIERLKGSAKTQSGYEDGAHFISSARFAPYGSGRVTLDYYELDASKRSTIYVRSEDGSWTVAATLNGWTEQGRPIQIDVKESFTDPPVLLATHRPTKTSRVILDPNPQLKDVELGEASVYKWKDKNGREWVGGLYKPPEYVRGQRYPLVVQTHGFFESLFRPDGIYPTAFAARELAAAEILVLQVPDCPVGTNPEEGPCNVVGYEAGVDKLVADGVVDPQRIGIVGFSRTCYYVMKALTTSLRHFRAASITDGINFGYLEYMATLDMRGNGVPHEADGVIGASPFREGLQQWFKWSPEFNMDKVKTPLQVVANGRLGLLFMWEPYATLRFLNRPVDLVMLRQGTHVLTNPAERMASQGGTVDWFRFWLKDEEDPDPAKAEQYARWRDLRKLEEKEQKDPVLSDSP